MTFITQKHPEHPLRQLWFFLIPLFTQGHKLIRNVIRVSQMNLLLLSLGSLTLCIRLLSQLVLASPGPVRWCPAVQSFMRLNSYCLLNTSLSLPVPWSVWAFLLPACPLFLIHPNCCLPLVCCSTLVFFCLLPRRLWEEQSWSVTNACSCCPQKYFLMTWLGW